MLQNLRLQLLVPLQTNPRLRWGLWCIVGILWLYGILLLRDEVQAGQAQYQSIENNIARTRAQEVQKEWPERVAPATLLAVQLESRLWQSATPGLAQAALQDWLNQALAQAMIAKPRVTMSALGEIDPGKDNAKDSTKSNTPTPSQFWKIRARIDIDFTPASFMALLGKIETHDKQIVVESLNIRSQPTPRAELVLLAYFQKPAATGSQ